MYRIRELRNEISIYAWELGEKIGVSESTILGYEKNNHQPNIDKLIAIADFFNVSVDYLIGRVDNRSKYLNVCEIENLSNNYKNLKRENEKLIRRLKILHDKFASGLEE